MADELIDLTNRVKLATIALAEANNRKQLADKANYAAGEDVREADAALKAAERALIKFARSVSA